MQRIIICEEYDVYKEDGGFENAPQMREGGVKKGIWDWLFGNDSYDSWWACILLIKLIVVYFLLNLDLLINSLVPNDQ